MSYLISVLNNQRQSGKTVTSVNLAASLAVAEKRVALIDFDSKPDATHSLGFMRSDYKKSIYNLLTEDIDINEVILPTILPKLSLIPGSSEILEIDLKERYTSIFNAKFGSMMRHFNDYDFVVLDCPHNIGTISLKILKSAHSILVPVKIFAGSFTDIIYINRYIQHLFESEVPKKDCLYVINGYDPNIIKNESVFLELHNLLKESLFESSISLSTKVKEAFSIGIPLPLYDIACPAAISYMTLAARYMSLIESTI